MTALLAIALVACTGSSYGCGSTSSDLAATAKAAGRDFIACTSADVVDLVSELTPLAEQALEAATNSDRSIDTDKIKAATSKAKSTALSCAISTAFAHAIKLASRPRDPNAPASDDQTATPEALQGAFAEVCATMAPGTTFETSEGKIACPG